jgi:hypothetical protein
MVVCAKVRRDGACVSSCPFLWCVLHSRWCCRHRQSLPRAAPRVAKVLVWLMAVHGVWVVRWRAASLPRRFALARRGVADTAPLHATPMSWQL